MAVAETLVLSCCEIVVSWEIVTMSVLFVPQRGSLMNGTCPELTGADSGLCLQICHPTFFLPAFILKTAVMSGCSGALRASFRAEMSLLAWSQSQTWSKKPRGIGRASLHSEFQGGPKAHHCGTPHPHMSYLTI